MSEIDGGDFSALRRSSDVGGAGVQYDEGLATQTIPLYPEIRRRSRPVFAADGWMQVILENVHSAADTEESQVSPYAAGGAAQNGFPAAVQEGLDLWLLGIAGQRSSGGGDLTAAVLQLTTGTSVLAIGIDDAGDPVAAGAAMALAHSSAIFTTQPGILAPMVWGDGTTLLYPKLRISRGSLFSFHTESAAAAEFKAILTMGIFPMAMGQDVVD